MKKKQIVIMGGGTAGWISALYFLTNNHTFDVKLISSSKIGTIGVGEGSTPLLKNFIDETLDFICKELPDLKLTLEHITTKEATFYVNEGNKNLVASITPHHLALNRNAIFAKGINYSGNG